MCLGVPGQIVEVTDPVHGLAKVDMGGRTQQVNLQMLMHDDTAPQVGDWVLVHLGLAMETMSEEEAQEVLGFLDEVVPPTEAP